MSKATTTQISFVNFVTDFYEKAANDAGHSGSHGDGGEGAAMDVLDAYALGKLGGLAEDLKPFSHLKEDWKNANDSEWAEYQRLKEKFDK